MGQAKNRKAEIAALKAQKTKLGIVAYRHLLNGQREMCVFRIEANPKDQPTDRQALLYTIAMKPWGHNPPAEAIFAYALTTQTYAMSKLAQGDPYGMELNFYEGTPSSVSVDRKPYSCRTCVAARTEADFMTLVQQARDWAEQDAGTDLKTHTEAFV